MKILIWPVAILALWGFSLDVFVARYRLARDWVKDRFLKKA